jgi:hypothetical protein
MDRFTSFRVLPETPQPENEDGSYLISIDLTSREAGSVEPTTILPEPIILKGPVSVETITDEKELDGYSAGKYYSAGGDGLVILHGEVDEDQAEVSETTGTGYKTTTSTAKELMAALDKHVEEEVGGRRRRRRQTRKRSTRRTKTSRRRQTRSRRVRK